MPLPPSGAVEVNLLPGGLDASHRAGAADAVAAATAGRNERSEKT